MYRFILILILFQTISGHSQRIFTAVGPAVSIYDWKISYGKNDDYPYKDYKSPILSISAALGYETKQWNRLSFSFIGSYFGSGGKNYAGDVDRYNTISIGAIPNFYMVNRSAQFYIGAGPRFDCVLINQGSLKFGATGTLGFNYQFDHLVLGLKANCHYRFGYLAEQIIDMPDDPDLHITIKDYPFDLQFVIGYRFGKKKAD